jgi:hypothetical protein
VFHHFNSKAALEVCMKKSCVMTFAAVVLSVIAPSTVLAQNTPAVGVGVKAGTLGIGVDGAVRVAPRVAVRGGFNFFNYNHTFDQDGTAYDGTLKLQSIEAAVDLGLGGGFRFSPGLLLRNNNHLDAVLSVPGGQTFTLGGTSYMSQSGTPLGGTGLLDFKKVAPMLGIGFGSMVPTGDRHFTAAFDLGVVFQDKPNVALALSGNACLVNSNGTAGQCAPVNSLPGVAANIADEQVKVGDDLKFLRYYPVVSFGIGWKF